MEVKIEIPDEIAKLLQSEWNPNLSRQCLEALAVEGYRLEILTRGQIKKMLGFDSLYEVDGFLKKEKAYLHYNEDDFEADLLTMKQVRESNRKKS